MERETSSVATLGIVLIALAVLIGLGFGIFAIARGTANEGVTNVQDKLGQVSASEFTDYDQKIVTGTQVMSAYSNFDGKSYAILINTQALRDGSTNGDTGSQKIAAKGYDGGKVTSSTIKSAKSDGSDVDLVFRNYNAVLNNAAIGYDNGIYKTEDGFKVTSGKVNFFTKIGSLSKSGMAEYIPSGGRFQANILKDASGTIMGIVFEQVSSK